VPLVTTDELILRAFPKNAVPLKNLRNKMNRKLNITVMLGGPSAEREVSLRTGAAWPSARSLGHVVHELDPQTPSGFGRPDGRGFSALHGTTRNARCSSKLDGLGVPYTAAMRRPAHRF